MSVYEEPKTPLGVKLNRLGRGVKKQIKTIRSSFLFICFWSTSYTGWFFPETPALNIAIMVISTILILFHLVEIFIFTRLGYCSAWLEDAEEELRITEEEVKAVKAALKEQELDLGDLP